MPPPPRPKKVKPPTHATPDQIRDRQRGALLGLAVGEAMGIRMDQRNVPAANFPNLNDGPYLEPMGGGRLELRRGQVTWPSEMAQVLSQSLRNQRRYDVFDVAKSYARWLPTTLEAPEAMKAPMEWISEGRSPENTGRRAWLESAQRLRDNAPLARTTPIGVFFHARRDERVQASLEDVSITHFDPLTQLACSTFNGILAAAISAPGERLEPDQLLKVAEAELSLAASVLGRKESDWVGQTKDGADWLREDFKYAQDDDPELYGPDLHLFRPWPSETRVTYRLAFWELFHAPSLEAALIDVANRGGHSTVNCAVTGALFGAIFGDEAIPRDWEERVLEAPGNGAYHPRNLITLAGLGPDDQ
ncbi:MAG: ADP-ribosylglycohydrolase family protein [Archangium gephyra]|uniref:ADP-ribosylglycohydrolase family protein n=1 Tax=Archangium gephyra TaxID=48 RepID=A0A2W5UFF2_9BACT|nr:MAG: ADP-ribosylglycohydrolase family protein [Archangium gephyra]